MIVALTAGLSLASRTISNLKLSKQNQDAQRAFQAASAGIDKYINSSTLESNPGSEALSNSQFDSKITEVKGVNIVLNNGEKIDQDLGIDVWLSSYPDYTAPYAGSIDVFWGTGQQLSSNCTPASGKNSAPAIEIVILSGSVSSPSLSRYAFDPCSRTGFTGVSPGSYVVGGSTFLYKATTPAIASGLIMKIIPIYNATAIGVTASTSGGLPAQGKIIESVGTSGDAKRKVVYFESYPQIPIEIFPNTILSQ